MVWYTVLSTSEWSTSCLEAYDRETAGIEQNTAMAKTKLSEVERHLKLALKDNGKVGILTCLCENGTLSCLEVYGREIDGIEQNPATLERPNSRR